MHLKSRDKTYYRELADRYKKSTNHLTFEALDVVRWAKNELQLAPEIIEAVHVDRLSESLRSHTTKDTLGRKVRLRHCVQTTTTDEEGDPIQRYLWAHIDDASDEHLRTSLYQRRERINSDVESLKADIEFINARRLLAGKEVIQMSFNFDPKQEETDEP